MHVSHSTQINFGWLLKSLEFVDVDKIIVFFTMANML